MSALLAVLIALQAAVGGPVRVDIHLMPPGASLKLETGEEVRYFTFEEYKTLLSMDNELWELRQRLETYQSLDAKYQALLGQKDSIISTLRKDTSILKTRSERLDLRWQECEEALVEASGGPVWPYVVGAAGAVIGVAGFVVGTTLYLID